MRSKKWLAGLCAVAMLTVWVPLGVFAEAETNTEEHTNATQCEESTMAVECRIDGTDVEECQLLPTQNGGVFMGAPQYAADVEANTGGCTCATQCEENAVAEGCLICVVSIEECQPQPEQTAAILMGESQASSFYDEDEYDAGDVAVINAIIQNNGLVANPDEPETWTYPPIVG